MKCLNRAFFYKLRIAQVSPMSRCYKCLKPDGRDDELKKCNLCSEEGYSLGNCFKISLIEED